MGLPYVLNNGNVAKFLKEIVSAPVPSKVDYKYLETRGYTGKNDRYLVAFLKNLGFVDNGGGPAQRWHDHRHAGQSAAVLAAGVTEAYQGFFGVYPDAPKRSEEEFTNWARVEDSSASPTTIKRSWATFKAVVPLCDFDVVPTVPPSNPGPSTATNSTPATVTPPLQPAVQLGRTGGITINIELQLPATADASFFDEFFTSMRKNLIDHDD